MIVHSLIDRIGIFLLISRELLFHLSLPTEQDTLLSVIYRQKEKNWGPVHTTPEEFENELKRSFISTVTANPSRKQSFLKTLFGSLQTWGFWNRRVFVRRRLGFCAKETGFLLSCWEKTFWKRWRHDNHVIFLPDCFLNTNPKWSGIKFLWHCVTGNIWCVFRVKISPA